MQRDTRRRERRPAVDLPLLDDALAQVEAPGQAPPGPTAISSGGHRFDAYSLLPAEELEVSRPGDAAEVAADRMAGRVLAEGPAGPVAESGAPSGAPLPDTVRQTFETRFGHEFGQVRVHADGRAADAAAALDARAFTAGSEIVFGAGQYAPQSPAGQRLLAHELAHVVQSGGSGQTVYRWHDDGHKACAGDAARIVFVGPSAQPFFDAIGMDRETFIARLEDASCNMDRVAGHIRDRYLSTLPAFGLSLVTSGIRNLFQEATGIQTEESKTRRGIVGEGLNHGEAGNYQEPKESAAPRNEAHSLKFASEAVAAFASGDYDLMINKLGDAVHVSADRGSHEEGGIGRGHDIRMPREDLGESGTDINAGYMENWDDNDSLSLNPVARAVGTEYTVGVLVAFFSEALPLLAQNNAGAGGEQTAAV
jgi:hypothetical protein